MKWKAIDSGYPETYAWRADVTGYYVSRGVVRGESRFIAWFNGRPLHDDYCETPRQAQQHCENHFKRSERKSA